MKRKLWLLVVVPVLGACDLLGYSGPGALTARLDAEGVVVGSAVLRVSGAGVRRFSGAGGTRVFSREQDEADTWRVVVVNPNAGELLFRIEVEDVAAAAPSARVVSAADRSDETIAAGGDVRVTIDRR